MCAHGLGIIGLHLPQALLVMFFGKMHVHQELRFYLLKRFTSL
jgi:hypothetical protein